MDHIDIDHNRKDHDGTRVPGPLVEIGDSWGDGSPTWFTPEPPANRRRRVTRVVLATGLGAAVIAIAAAVQLASGPARPLPSGLGFSPAPTLVVPTVDASPVASVPAAPATHTTPQETRSGGPHTSVTTSALAGVSPTQAATASPSPTAWTTLTVRATTVLNRGESVQTNRTRLIMQANGDLAIIDEVGAMRWHSATNGPGDHAVFQNDGNLVVYDKANTPLWTSDTAGHSGAVLVLADDGNVTIVFNGAVSWSSNTAH